ncbi:MAG: ABC transporter ATP-binding protein [Chloroflexi bacterium]|nr:ABC transporter ATP-binding protein [Chloroflexota bacterium]
MSSEPALLAVRGLTTRFPGVVANDGIDFTLYSGEIHALLGENGAGKSTLMNVLYGLVRPAAGTITLRGQPFRPASPRTAIAAGVGMVHQHFTLVPTLTVTENVILGAEPVRAGLALDLRSAAEQVRRLSEEHGLEVAPDALVRDLPVGAQQRVEILKALYRRADLLILDEPTAVLAPPEVERLFAVMRRLAAEGRALVFITHKLREVLAVADRITVLRQGRVVATTTPAETDETSLAELMVGHQMQLHAIHHTAAIAGTVLRVRDLRVRDDAGALAVDGVDLEIRSGQIVGLAGVEGNGQTELIEALAGLRRPDSGVVELLLGDRAGHDPSEQKSDGPFSTPGETGPSFVDAKLRDLLRPGSDGGPSVLVHDVTGLGPRELGRLGVAHVPEDRHKHGLVLAHPLADNLVLSRHADPPFARGFRRVFEAIRGFARGLVDSFAIHTASVDVPTGTLSGGNQQKAVVARELSRPLRLLLVAQPTRGVDVGATELIHTRILAARDAGAAILLVSAELDEVLALADRVGVMYRGQIRELVPTDRADRTHLGLLMGGGRPP